MVLVFTKTTVCLSFFLSPVVPAHCILSARYLSLSLLFFPFFFSFVTIVLPIRCETLTGQIVHLIQEPLKHRSSTLCPD